MKNTRLNKGITLIALIITVVILLILAGTAISISLNSDNLFSKSQNAVEQWNEKVGDEDSLITTLNRYVNGEFEIIAVGHREKADVFGEMGIQYISMDISNEADFEKLPKDDVYAVVDLAAVIPAYMDGYHPEKYLSSIIMGTYNVLEYCRKNNVEKLLYSTSCYDMWEYPAGTVIKPDMPRELLKEHEASLHEVARVLMENEAITGTEIDAIIERIEGSAPPSAHPKEGKGEERLTQPE